MGWGCERLVKKDEIQKKISELMTKEKLNIKAKRVGILEELLKMVGVLEILSLKLLN